MTSRGEMEHRLLVAVDQVARGMRAVRQRLATRHGVSLLQILLIELLGDCRPRRVGAIAAELAITQATTSEAVATLETKGLVSRVGDPSDGRVTVVAIEQEGLDLAAVIARELEPLMEIEASITDDDVATVVRVLLTELRRLHTAGLISVNRSCLTCRYYREPEPSGEAHCMLLDSALFDRDLRVDCPEHQPSAR